VYPHADGLSVRYALAVTIQNFAIDFLTFERFHQVRPQFGIIPSAPVVDIAQDPYIIRNDYLLHCT
jgi:hypothetical protein